MYEFVTKGGVEHVAEIDINEWFRNRTDDAGIPTEPITQKLAVHIKAKEEAFSWILSDDAIDRDREIIDPRGWDLKAYKKNPVVLWGHNSFTPAIGKMVSVQRRDNALVGKIIFDESGADPLALMIAAKVRSGILTAGSVGFRVMKIEFEENNDDIAAVITKAELFEFSVVNIPSNPNAVVQRSMPQDVMPTPDVEISGVNTGAIIIDSETGVAGKHYTSTLYDEDQEDRKTSDRGNRETSDAPEAQDQRGTDLDDLFVSDTKQTLEEIFNGPQRNYVI